MKKFTIAFVCFFSFATVSNAQERETTKLPAQNSFYAEIGGPGIMFSANIDHRFSKSHLGFGGRVGLGFVSGNFEDINSTDYRQRSIVTIPLQLNYVFGKEHSPHTFEVGAGATFLGKKVDILSFDNDQQSQVYGTASFMYRLQPINGGFSWRIGFTPLIAEGYIQPFAGVSFGYNF